MSHHQRKLQSKIEYETGLWVLRVGIAVFLLVLLLAAGFLASFNGDTYKFTHSLIFPISILLGFVAVVMIIPGVIFVLIGDGEEEKDVEKVRLPGTPKPVTLPEPAAKPKQERAKSKLPSNFPKFLFILGLLCVITFVGALIIVAMVML